MAVIAKCIDHVSALSGKIAAWLCLVLIGELVYDTVARYGFNAPTEWSYDISYMFCGTLFMIGASWTLLQGEHVRIGIFYDRASPRVQAALTIAGYIVFFFPSMAALLWYGADFALASWRMQEHAGVSMWSPPIYPFKTIIPIAALLLLLQGSVLFARTTVRLVKGEPS